MEILLLTSARPGEPAAVLPALDLLPHSVRTAPRDVRTLVAGPSPDVVLIDARSELADARATSRMLHATGLGVPLVAVVSESGRGWRRSLELKKSFGRQRIFRRSGTQQDHGGE